MYGNTDILKLILDKEPNLIETKDYRGYTALHLVSIPLDLNLTGNLEVCKALVEIYNASLSTKDNSGDTPLSTAIKDGDKKVAKYLFNA